MAFLRRTGWGRSWGLRFDAAFASPLKRAAITARQCLADGELAVPLRSGECPAKPNAGCLGGRTFSEFDQDPACLVFQDECAPVYPSGCEAPDETLTSSPRLKVGDSRG